MNEEPIAGKTYTDDWWQNWLNGKLNGVANNDISAYLEDVGYDPESEIYADFSSTISDPKMVADFTAARDAAVKSGNQKLTNTLDLIFKYGEKAVAALVTAGVLDGPALAKSGYTNVTQDAGGTIKIGQVDTTQKAPLPAGAKLFGLDFSSPTVIIVTFIVLMLLAYFLFFKKEGRKRNG
ncbi:hypothetical protein GCM10028807_50020 [Spirosoma daeguense]